MPESKEHFAKITGFETDSLGFLCKQQLLPKSAVGRFGLAGMPIEVREKEREKGKS